MSEKEPKMKWFRFSRWVCKCLCFLFFRLRISGKENVPEKGAVLLISNHQSFLDPVLCGILLKRPLYFLARDTLFENWFFGRLITSINTIPVKRGEADFAAMRIIISRLQEGFGVCLFPEGTRTKDGKISQFKPGLALLSRRGNAAIVPVAIEGAFECWPKHKKLFSLGSKIAVSYGKCLTAEQIRNMGDEELAAHLTQTLRKMQNESRIKYGKTPFEY